MQFYFAGCENDEAFQAVRQACHEVGIGRPNALLSYFSMANRGNVGDELLSIYAQSGRIFMDSGAFSAFTTGRPIRLGDWEAFVQRHRHLFAVYANLDVIGDWASTMVNQRRLEVAGLKPLPVFHVTSAPLDQLHELCKCYDYIGLGGIAVRKFSKTEKRERLMAAWSVITGYWKAGRKIKVHGLGVSGADFLDLFPWYSCDSTTWLVGSRYGLVCRFDKLKTRQFGKRSLRDMSAGDLGLIDPPGCTGKYATERLISNAADFAKMVRFYTDVWTKRGVTWED